jgi:hypothetical protein
MDEGILNVAQQREFAAEVAQVIVSHGSDTSFIWWRCGPQITGTSGGVGRGIPNGFTRLLPLLLLLLLPLMPL